MAISSFCSFNLPPSSVPSSHITIPKPAPAQLIPWRRRCLLGLMCAIVASESENFISDRGAAAMEMEVVAAPVITRWSDRRECFPWRINSLETIVPENLPRPSGRRRWDFTGITKEAPIVKATAGSSEGASCFTL